jgi:hypothetical protein
MLLAIPSEYYLLFPGFRLIFSFVSEPSQVPHYFATLTNLIWHVFLMKNQGGAEGSVMIAIAWAATNPKQVKSNN